MEWDAIHYLAIINSVRVSVSAPPVDTRLPERGRSAERRIFTQTTRLKTKRRGTKKKTRRGDGVGTDWCRRSVRARSVCGPICGAESWQGRSGLARWLTFSVRTAALCCGECGAVITPANYTELSSLSSPWHILSAARGPEVLHMLPSSVQPDQTQIGQSQL